MNEQNQTRVNSPLFPSERSCNSHQDDDDAREVKGGGGVTARGPGFSLVLCSGDSGRRRCALHAKTGKGWGVASQGRPCRRAIGRRGGGVAEEGAAGVWLEEP